MPIIILPYNTRSQAFLLSWVSIYEFYIRLKTHQNDFKSMSIEMQEFYKTPKFVQNNFANKTIVVAFDSERSEYVRGRVFGHKVDEMGRTKYSIKCLDYGNKFERYSHNIDQLDKCFMCLPPTAIRCSLGGVIMNHDREETEKRVKTCIDSIEEFFCEFNGEGLTPPLPFIETPDTDGDEVVLVDLILQLGSSFKNILAEQGLISLLPRSEGTFYIQFRSRIMNILIIKLSVPNRIRMLAHEDNISFCIVEFFGYSIHCS